MENELIYLEGKSEPFTKEQLAELIIQEAAGKAEKLFLEFTNDYHEDLLNHEKSEKKKILIDDLAKLKLKNKIYNSWNDPSQIKNDIINMVKPLRADELGKLKILESLWRLDIDFAINLALAIKKKAFFRGMLDDLTHDINPGAQITYNRSAYEFGFMMHQLEKKGYIELPPGKDSEGSYEQLAKILYSCFKVNAKWSTFKDALNPNRNFLCDTKRTKLEGFPNDFSDASELGHFNKGKKK